MQNKGRKPNDRSHPYRGILKEIATEQGVTQQAIYQAVKIFKNPRIMKIYSAKRKKREREYAAYL